MILSYGPYEKAQLNVSTKKTRLQFLWNAKATVPSLTKDLSETVFPLFLKHRLDNTKKRQSLKSEASSFPSFDCLWKQINSSSRLAEIRDLLYQWSIRHNLDAEWCRQWGVRAMTAWASDPEAQGSLSWCRFPEIARYILFPEFYPTVVFDGEQLRTIRWLCEQFGILDFGPDDTSECEFPLPPPGLPLWWPTAVSRNEYLNDVERLAQEEILKSCLAAVESSYQHDYVERIKSVAAQYCKSIENRFAKSADWKKAKVHTDHRAHLWHVVAAVMFQIRGKSYTEIASEISPLIDRQLSVSTVQRGVGEILDVIGLDIDRRRELRRGPRRGTVQSPAAKVMRSLGRN